MTCVCCGNADAATEPTARDATLCWECRNDFVDLSHMLSASDWDEDRVDTDACAELLQQVRLSVFEQPAVMVSDPLDGLSLAGVGVSP